MEKKITKKIKTKSKLINVKEVDNWYFDSNKNLYHKSKQFLW